MQCPTCGMTMPGLQERCANCDAPLVQPQQAYGGQHTAMPGSWQGPAAPGSLPSEPFGAQPAGGHPSAPLPLGAPIAAPAVDGEAQPADANEPTAPWSIQDDEPEAPQMHQPGWSPQGDQPQSSQPPTDPFQASQPPTDPFQASQPQADPFQAGQPQGETPTASIVPDDWFVDARPPAPVVDQTATNPYDTSNAAPGGGSVPLDPWMQPPVEQGQYAPQPVEQGPYGPQPTQVESFGSNPTRVQQFGPAPTQVQGGFGANPTANPTQVEQAPFGPQDTRLESWGSPQQGWGGGHAPPGQNQTAVMGAPGFGPGPGPGGPHGPGGPQGPGGYGPGYPPPPQGGAPAKERKANKNLMIAVAGLVTVAVVTVGWISLSGGGGGKTDTPAGSSTAAANKGPDKSGGTEAHSQAVAVNDILDASLKSRSQINGALSRARKCEGIDPAISTMQQVSSDRQNQIQRANALKLTKLSQGDQIRSTLIKAITTSANADNAFLKWAQADHGCKGKPKGNSNQRQGYELSNTASADKKEFVRFWNPVATKEGLAKRGADSF